ncbi:MAG: hypothetical protein IPL79_00600 [Myxococcales bacterium]|nr:hypothetical protein [Myxococcales bacterium]
MRSNGRTTFWIAAACGLLIAAASSRAANAEPSASHVTVSAELGGAAITNHPTYLIGTGTNLGLGVMFRDRLSLEWMLSSYSTRAKDGLHASNTSGRLRFNAIAIRLRLPLLPISVGGGIGQANVPLLARDEWGVVESTSVRQVGAFATGAVILLRSRAVSVYAEGRFFVPIFKELPPPHYPAQGGDAIYPSTDDDAYPLLMLGIGVRVAM